MHDTFSDFLTRLRNAGRARHRYVDVCTNKMICHVIAILEKEGFIDRYQQRMEGPQALARIFLRYDDEKEPLIQSARSISTPGRRKYCKSSRIRPVLAGLGISIFTTSQGVMTGLEAKRKNVGGELLCQISS